MIEVRWHGRGGQGVVTAANLLGATAVLEGRHAQSFPFFGAERRGAPVAAFTRIDSRPIRLRSQIYQPHWVVLLDDSLLAVTSPLEGLREDGVVVVNTRRPDGGARDPVETLDLVAMLPLGARVISLDATAIAREWLGREVANTVMLGALAAAGLVGLPALRLAIADAFPGEAGERNARAAEAAYAAVGNSRAVVMNCRSRP